MGRRDEVLKHIEMYRVLIEQQEFLLETYKQLKKTSNQNFTDQEASVHHILAANKTRLAKYERELEELK